MTVSDKQMCDLVSEYVKLWVSNMLNLSRTFAKPYHPAAIQGLHHQQVASLQHLEKYREAQKIEQSMGQVFEQLSGVLKAGESSKTNPDQMTQSEAWQTLIEELETLQEMLQKVGDPGQAQYVLQRLQSNHEIRSILERVFDRKLQKLFQKSLQREWERFRLHDKADAYSAHLKRLQNEPHLPLRSLPEGVDILEALSFLSEHSQTGAGPEHSADLLRLLIDQLKAQAPETPPESHY